MILARFDWMLAAQFYGGLLLIDQGLTAKWIAKPGALFGICVDEHKKNIT